MLAMATREFWAQATQENGVTDMATVEEAREQAVKDLNDEFFFAHFQI